MRGTYRVSVVACWIALTTAGCAASGQARYVYQDGQFGVVGIPENTSRWPSFYRDQAETLMARHFPEGFEIVRAEEVVEGSRTLTLNGTNSAQVEAATVVPILKLGKLGRVASRTQADNVKIKECRILYKKAGCDDSESEPGYAGLSSLSPEPYIDPNADARHHVVAKPPTKTDEPDTTKLAEAATKDGVKAAQDAAKDVSTAKDDHKASHEKSK
ncbi:MAG: hypothetical protein JWN86_3541 [Planctomycetota bacterium]|nr:hypothetical protein [Planctomycetota bacterium]